MGGGQLASAVMRPPGAILRKSMRSILQRFSGRLGYNPRIPYFPKAPSEII